ncbi:MAG: hypothetical protein HKN27_04770 [Silicimonas sp.]|nr:hypothetical protein [Silicimonas sp.]
MMKAVNALGERSETMGQTCLAFIATRPLIRHNQAQFPSETILLTVPFGIIIFLPDWIGRLRTAIFLRFSQDAL